MRKNRRNKNNNNALKQKKKKKRRKRKRKMKNNNGNNSKSNSALKCGSEGRRYESHQSPVGPFGPDRLLLTAGSAIGPVGRQGPHIRVLSTSQVLLCGC